MVKVAPAYNRGQQRECQAWGRTFRVTSAEIAARVLNVRNLEGPRESKAQLWVHTVAEVAMAQ
jgi:hypothetical protein